jgi:zinc transport system ATP-binding protein
MKTNGTPQPLISMHNMGVKRGDDWLVRGVSLSITRGEIVTLIGPNGSGKSTTAKVITGVLKQSEGTLIRKPGLKIALVPQKLNIEWTMPLSVGRLMALSEPNSKTKILDELEKVGADALYSASVQHLSGGEFQRVLLARAMIRKPDLLVLDEPVQGVDHAGQAALYRLIGDIRTRTGCGILLISHDLHVVMAGTDKVICLNGHMCCSGSPELVAQSEAFKNLFGSSSAQALAIYPHSHTHDHQPLKPTSDRGHTDVSA